MRNIIGDFERILDAENIRVEPGAGFVLVELLERMDRATD